MHTSYISTLALRNAPRADIVRLQSELTDKTVEAATSRHADVGLALGPGAGRTVSTRMDLSLLESLMRSNAGASARLSQSQNALSDLETTASEMLAALVALPPGDASARTLEVQAETALDTARTELDIQRTDNLTSIEKAEMDLERARKEWEKAIGEARRKREKKEAEGAAPGSPGGPDAIIDKARDALAGLGDIGDLVEQQAAKIGVKGTFNAAAIRGLVGGDAADRTAKATEETAKNTKKLVQAAQTGGLTFA